MRKLTKTLTTLTAALGAAGLAMSAQGAMIGFETTENYAVGNLSGQPSSGTQWTRTNGNDDSMISVAATVGVGGTAGLKNQQGGGSNFTYYRIPLSNADIGTTFNAATTVLDYSFDWRLTDEAFGTTTGSAVFQFAMGGTSNTTSDSVMRIEVRNSGRFFAAHGGGNAAVDNKLSAETWHTISGTVNYATNTFTVFVDGEQQFTNVNSGNLTFLGSSVENANVYLANLNASSTSTNYLNWNLDNLSVVPEPASLALMGLGGLLVLGRRRQA